MLNFLISRHLARLRYTLSALRRQVKLIEFYNRPVPNFTKLFQDISYLMFKTRHSLMCYGSPKFECMTKSYYMF